VRSPFNLVVAKTLSAYSSVVASMPVGAGEAMLLAELGQGKGRAIAREALEQSDRSNDSLTSVGCWSGHS